MRAIYLSLIAAILICPLLWSAMDEKSPPVHPGPLKIEAKPLPLDSSDPQRIMLGSLRYLGGWQLKSPNPALGGISSMDVLPDQRFLALSDTGILFGFTIPIAASSPFVAPLPLRAMDLPKAKDLWDTESMTRDPATGQYWVGFEMVQRICRYAPEFARAQACVDRPEMKDWPITGGPEAMARLPDGRFVAFGETAPGPKGGNDMLLFPSDPVAPGGSPKAIRMSYIPPQGYVPTDAVWIGNNRLLMLNRRVTLFDGFTAVITMLDISDMHKDAVLRPQEIARLAPPVLADNFEAMAVEKRDGQSILWIASDDNHMFFQRTLLLKFALPPELELE
ncbi:MAG: esterase-like activity of phytase family protein [Sphingobium sp.]